MCSTDEAALGALAAFDDLGVHPHAEVSVVGFNGLLGLPQTVSTVTQDFAALAGGALELVDGEADAGGERERWVEARLLRPQATVRRRGR